MLDIQNSTKDKITSTVEKYCNEVRQIGFGENKSAGRKI